MSEIQKRPDSHGKVRDIYDCGDSLLMVASDRISAYDFILPDEIPHKGEILTRISAFWFERFADLMPNHMISCDVADFPEEFQQYGDYLAGRSMLVKKAQTVPIECIVRGYLTGSGKKTYDADGTVCGIKLPEGLTEASKLPQPIFTPSTKAELGDHDENISFQRCCEIVGDEVALQLRSASLAIYKAAAEYAATRGIIIADTKFEFGFIDGKLTLIDECLTPDSSRFWPVEGYAEGQVQPKLKGADGVAARQRFQGRAIQAGLVQPFPEGGLHPVVIAVGVGAGLRCAFAVLQQAGFVLCGEGNAAQMQ